MIPPVTLGREIEWQLEALRYYLPENILLPKNKISISSLNQSDAEFIVANSNYKQYIERDYIRERIACSFSAAVLESGKLVAWALTHDDGAIGTLHVLDEHRHNGYAAEIIISLAGFIRKANEVPIAQIEEKNLPAIKLFEKLGFVKDRKITWLKLTEKS